MSEVELAFLEYLDIRDITDGQELASVDVNWENEAVLVTISPDDRTVRSSTYSGEVARIADGQVFQRVQLPPLKFPIRYTCGLSGGRFLLAAPRSGRYSDGSWETNGHIVAADGSIVSNFNLGDGIEDVQIDRKDDLWVSYFDEGVLGSRCYQTDENLAKPGLVQFDTNGNRLWRFQPPSGFNGILDCYALNVTRDSIWLCYYTEFPIVRIGWDKTVRGWHNDLVKGAHTIAVEGDHILLARDYEKRSALLKLGEESAELVGNVDLKLPPEPGYLIGRGAELHYFAEKTWYRTTIEELL